MSEWKTYKLGEIAQIIGGGTPSTKVEDYWNGNIGWLTPRDLTGYSNNYISKGERSITEEGLKNSSARLLPKGTVLMTSRAPIGYIAIADNELCTNQGFKNFIVDETIVRNDFLYYQLKNNIDRIKSLGTGSTFAEVSATILKSIDIEIPDLPTQQQIAQILTSLDDKIELNLQMNKTLEAMAQAIFKEWFVDFNFPGFDGELVDGLPKGWRKEKLSESITIKHGYAFKGEFFSEIEQNDILLTPGNFKIGGGFNSTKFKYYNGEVPEDYILNRNDLVVTMTDLSKAGDTLGYSALVPSIEGKRLLHNQRIGKIIFKSEIPLKFFLYWVMRQDEYRHFVLGSATGSTVRHTSPTRICDFQIIVPDLKTLENFNVVIEDLSIKQQENEIQEAYLVKTHDTLLPKLMNGQLEIKI